MTSLFFPAVMSAEAWKNFKPAARPALPANTKVERSDKGNTVTWDAVPGVEGYRIFRSEWEGGPFTWLNSPWVKMEKFEVPTDAQMAEFKAKAEEANAAKAKELGLEDVKKLKREDRVGSTQFMPEIKTPVIPNTLVKTTKFQDPDGKENHFYFITAEDKEGRQSRWFPNEPKPAPSNY